MQDHRGLCRALVMTGLEVLPKAAPVLVPLLFPAAYVHDAQPACQLLGSSAFPHHHSSSYVVWQPRWTHGLS
eukprot:10571-Amphidinium_carterae.1